MAGYNLGAATILESGVTNDNSGTLVKVINADTSTVTIDNTKVQGLVNLGTNAFSAYPLVPGVDLPHVGVVRTSATATELTTTTATTIATYTPTATGLFVIQASVTVVTAATTLTLTVSWTDPSSSSAQSYTWYNATSVPVGTTLQLPVFFAAAADAITVSATAGTASQVYVSAEIVEVV